MKDSPQKTPLLVFLIGLPLLLLSALLLRDFIAAWTQHIPPCTLYVQHQLYCPSCGGTRSVLSLLHGDFLSAWRHNAMPPFLLLLLMAFYAEAFAHVLFRKKLQILPRKKWFLLVTLLGFLVYFVARNLVF